MVGDDALGEESSLTESASERRKLHQRSGNRCAFTGCQRILTEDETSEDPLIALRQIAHIVAQKQSGPRGDSPLTGEERDSYENLILLCNDHHYIVDSQPHTYTVERLLGMKRVHEQWVEDTLGASKLPDIQDLVEFPGSSGLPRVSECNPYDLGVSDSRYGSKHKHGGTDQYRVLATGLKTTPRFK